MRTRTRTTHLGHELSDDLLVYERTSSLVMWYMGPKQLTDLVDEDYRGGETLSEGEHNPNRFLSCTHLLYEIKHVRLAVAG